MKTIDWVRFTKYITSGDGFVASFYNNVKIDKNGIGHTNEFEGPFFIITQEMVECAGGLLDKVHIVHEYPFEVSWDLNVAEILVDHHYIAYMMNKDVAKGLYKCKNLIKKEMNIDLNGKQTWVLGYGDGVPRYFDFTNGDIIKDEERKKGCIYMSFN